jgi:hypothetical protein
VEIGVPEDWFAIGRERLWEAESWCNCMIKSTSAYQGVRVLLMSTPRRSAGLIRRRRSDMAQTP